MQLQAIGKRGLLWHSRSSRGLVRRAAFGSNQKRLSPVSLLEFDSGFQIGRRLFSPPVFYFTSPEGLANFASSMAALLFTSSIWMVKLPLVRASVQRNGILT